MGTSIVDFIHEERIKEAEYLLRHTDFSLSLISSYLNYSSQSYFTRIFREKRGITPQQYRDRAIWLPVFDVKVCFWYSKSAVYRILTVCDKQRIIVGTPWQRHWQVLHSSVPIKDRIPADTANGKDYAAADENTPRSGDQKDRRTICFLRKLWNTHRYFVIGAFH